MPARFIVSVATSAIWLAGCAQPTASNLPFAIAPGAAVSSGIPCGHVATDRRASVPGCETFVLTAGPEISRDQLIDLNTRFRQDVPVIVTFDFDRDVLRPEARAILDRQAVWIQQYPGLRFSVFGHTDLVGSLDYNFGLAKRRADAVVNYLLQRGVSQSQLESVVSFGMTQPVIDIRTAEERNRRAVTEVSGFLRVAGRTTAPIPCSWLDVNYLPTYSQCIILGPVPMAVPVPVPPGPVSTPQSISATYTSGYTGGTASITYNADGSVTRSAGGITGPAESPRTETSVTSTELAGGGTGGVFAGVTMSNGQTLSASSTNNSDGTTTYQGGSQETTY
jgi:peptidoglycan-associated lipoprotein